MKRNLFFVSLFIILTIILLCLFGSQEKDLVETFNSNSVTSDEIKDEMIVAMFIEDIRKHGFFFREQGRIGGNWQWEQEF